MSTVEAVRNLDERKRAFIAALEDWTESVDPCDRGHVEHGPEAHVGRHLVHSVAGGFGANWDYDEAVAFINEAVDVQRTLFFGSGHVAWFARSAEGREVKFDTKREPVG